MATSRRVRLEDATTTTTSISITIIIVVVVVVTTAETVVTATQIGLNGSLLRRGRRASSGSDVRSFDHVRATCGYRTTSPAAAELQQQQQQETVVANDVVTSGMFGVKIITCNDAI